MIDLIKWEKISQQYHLSNPIDKFIIENLTNSLDDSESDSKNSFRFGVSLLCSSLNRGDTYLPCLESDFTDTIYNWLKIGSTSGEIYLEDKNEISEKIFISDVVDFLKERFKIFLNYLFEKKFNSVIFFLEQHNKDNVDDILMPIIFDDKNNRLYFQRYYIAVNKVNRIFPLRLGSFPFTIEHQDEIVPIINILKSTPAKIFPDLRQISALLLALRNKTLIISGGPGTGKTTIVLQILRLLLHAVPYLEVEDIKIAAPTGRAAARLKESINAGLEQILLSESKNSINNEKALLSIRGSTVHRLLEYNSSTSSFLRNHENPIDAKVVVVDEVSMIDIELFSCLLDALSEQCILILLGDRFQLPSVEAGAVLGDLTDIFDRKKGNTLSEKTIKDIKRIYNTISQINDVNYEQIEQAIQKETNILTDHAVILTQSYRSAFLIQKFADAVNMNEKPLDIIEKHPLNFSWENVLKEIPKEGKCIFIESYSQKEDFLAIEGWIRYHFGESYKDLLKKELLDDNDKPLIGAHCLLDAIEKSRILTFLREGERGANGINQKCCNILCSYLDSQGSPILFCGMPIIIKENSPNIGLFNGDCGVIIRKKTGGFTSLFRIGKDIVTKPLGILPAWESAFAMTVHKSQGSEYDNVLLILPKKQNPLCTREIIYTAITRAKKFVAILGTLEIFQASLEKIIRRNTGINFYS